MAVGTAAREYSFVVMGDFNPAILHPSWFASQGLIKHGEAVEAKIDVVHKEVASWSIEWLRVYSDGDRLQLVTEQEPFALPLRDLVMGVLTLLEHTPVRALGINFAGYYQFSDRHSYDRFGHELVPKARWGALTDPRTQKAMVTSVHSDGRSGATNVAVAASERFLLSARISSNDHTDCPRDELASGAMWAVRNVKDNWVACKERFERVVESLIEGY